MTKNPLRHASWALLLLSLAWPRQALGEEDVVKAAARVLGYEGIELFEKGEHAAALEKLTRASVLVRAPTLSLWRARTLEKLGRWLDAESAYAEAASFALPEPADPVLVDARDSAKRERAALDSRIPRLVIEVSGALARESRVRLGRADVQLGKELRVDPGEHHVVAEARGRRVEQTLRLEAGESRRMVLAISTEARGAPPRPLPRRAAAASSASGDDQRLAGFVALGVGAAGLLTGAAAGSYALVQRSSLDDACSDTECPPSERDRVDRYNTALTISTVGFVVGAVGSAAGATLLLTAPRKEQKSLALVLSPTGLDLRSRW